MSVSVVKKELDSRFPASPFGLRRTGRGNDVFFQIVIKLSKGFCFVILKRLPCASGRIHNPFRMRYDVGTLQPDGVAVENFLR